MRDDYREMPCYTTEAFDYMRGGKQPDLKVTWRNCLNVRTFCGIVNWRAKSRYSFRKLEIEFGREIVSRVEERRDE